MLNDSDIHKLKNFCQIIIEKPRPMHAQPFKVLNGKFWCEDWEIIEILKYFFNGESMYLTDPPPNRLKNNPLWERNRIIFQARRLAEEFPDVDNLINHLKLRREKNYGNS